MDVGEIPIKPLAPGGKTVLNCHFTAKTGMYGIELMLDPENLVIESDDQFMEGSYEDANIIRVPLSVQDEGDRDGVPFVVLWLPILLMLIVLVVLASFFHLRKKSSNRRNDGKSYFI
jgi:hypothetical protein